MKKALNYCAELLEMNCYLKTPTTNKAKQDIDTIAEREGFRNLSVSFGERGKIVTFFSKLLTVLLLPFRLKKGDVLLIQYPYKKYYETLCRIARIKGAKTVTLIHDLGTFRRHKLTATQEIKRLSQTDFIISHNASMTKWLKEKGCKIEIGNLEIFDYVEEETGNEVAGNGVSVPFSAVSSPSTRIIYAGGLGIRKNAFLYDFDPYLSGCTLNIYGKGLDEEVAKKWQNIRYNGFMPSKQFIATVQGDWGLVWDGDSLDGCSGNWGEYLRINNPHKTSFYLRAGLPVILWSESAMAPFIEKENIGITIDSLKNLKEKLAGISSEEYQAMKANVMAFKEKLDNGHFFLKAFKEALATIGEKNF